MSAHTGRLLLSPRDPFLLPDRARLTAALTKAGFLGVPLYGHDDTFAVGGHFLQLLTFAGCSVRIELSPSAGTPFCHVQFTGPFEWPVFLGGRNTRPPRCRGCRSPLQDWEIRVFGQDKTELAPVTCPTCGKADPLWEYDWKDKAGFGRLFVQVEEVFPGEAAPTPGLMDLLQGCTGHTWRYFYIQDA